MKKIKYILYSLVLITAVSCSEPDGIDSDDSFLETVNSGAQNSLFDISHDNSGLVRITPTGEGASSFQIQFGHGTGASASAVVSPGQSATHNYPEGSYTVTITSYDLAGNPTVNTYPLTVTYVAPINLVVNKTVSGHSVTVSATADYANGFLVYFGDVASEVGTPMAVGETLPAHVYASAGVYNLRVVALSGGAATSQVIEQIVIFDPFSLPITYESATQNYGIGGTFGGVDVAVVNNPFPGGINSSSKVWRYTKNGGAANWSGTWTPMSTPNSVPININNGSKIKVMVYSTEVGKKLNVELEQGTNSVPNQILKVASTVANQWEELV